MTNTLYDFLHPNKVTVIKIQEIRAIFLPQFLISEGALKSTEIALEASPEVWHFLIKTEIPNSPNHLQRDLQAPFQSPLHRFLLNDLAEKRPLIQPALPPPVEHTGSG